MHSDLISPDSSLHGTHELCCETVASVSLFFLPLLSRTLAHSHALSLAPSIPVSPTPTRSLALLLSLRVRAHSACAL